MGAIASVSNRYDYSESTEILPEAVESALKVLGNTQEVQQRDHLQDKISARVKAGVLDVPFYRRHPFYDFRFDKKLGEGAFSSVYKVTQVSKTGQIIMKNFSTDTQTPDWRPLRFAVKEVMLQDLTNQQLTNVQREIQFLSQLNHPDVVRMHSVFSTAVPDLKTGRPMEEAAVTGSIDLIRDKDKYTQLYIVLEYLQGGELLKAVCARSRYNEDDARELLLEIFEGIRYIHSRGIIHRDIKPENLILSSRGTSNKVKIVDFGFAVLSDELELEGSEKRAAAAKQKHSNDTPKENSEFLCGTPGYIAPEVLQSRTYTTKCDIWAAGVVMYILLSGTMPFAVDDTKSQMRGMYSLSSSRWVTVTTEAKDLVASLLKVNHNARLSAEQALDHPWMKKGARVDTPLKVVFEPSSASQGEPVVVVTPTPVTGQAVVASVDEANRTSPLFSNHAKSVRSVDTPNGKADLGDLTHNLPSLRHVSAAKRFKRGIKAVQSAIRFKALGQTRERRRSLSNADQVDAADSPTQQVKIKQPHSDTEAAVEASIDTDGADAGEGSLRKQRVMSDADAGSESSVELHERYEDFDDSAIN